MENKKKEIELSEKEFELLKELMYKETGVFLKPSKKNLMVSRLRGRIKELNLDSFDKYYHYLNSLAGKKEVEVFINSITTNETYFFRNDSQFKYMISKIIPKYINERSSSKKSIKIWSSACSTGEEPYTIAMILKQVIPNINSWKIDIYATDVNSLVIQTAKKGVYTEDRLRKLDKAWINKYFKKIDTNSKPNYEINSDIKRMIEFSQHNLMAPSIFRDLDIIFTSNVLIYFDPVSKQKVIENVSNVLLNNGYFFLGQAESLMGMKHSFKFLMPSSFIKDEK